MNILQSIMDKLENTILAKKYQSKSELCKMGDIVAMYDMALYFYQKSSAKLKSRLKRYEINPCEETKNELEKQMQAESDCGLMAQYYMMWMLRASMYGNKTAGNILSKCGFYKEEAYLTDKDYVEMCDIWSSNRLYDGGFCDVIRGEEDCRLIPRKNMRVFEFMYCSYYCPPDSDGFGSEKEFSSQYYDEFFMKLDIKSEAPEEILAALRRNEEIRKSYWNTQKYSDKRKYNRSVWE